MCFVNQHSKSRADVLSFIFIFASNQQLDITSLRMSAPPDCQACPSFCCNYFSQCPDTQSLNPLVNKCWTSQFSSNQPTPNNAQNSVATTPENNTGNGNNPLLSSGSEHNDDSSNNKSNQNDNSGSEGANVGLIVGVSVAVIIGLLLIVLIIYCCKCCCWNIRYDVEFRGNISNDKEMYRKKGRQNSNQYPPPYPYPQVQLRLPIHTHFHYSYRSRPHNTANDPYFVRYAHQPTQQNILPPYLDNSLANMSNVKSKSTNKYISSPRDTVA